jgi:peroxiredoxin
LQESLDEILTRNAVLLSISKYDAEETASWLEENAWSFPLLCDGIDVIKQYNLFNENWKRPGREGIPHPATVIVDRDGIVRFTHVWVDYRHRTPVETIIMELDKLK